jgi:hypothetical protein
VFAAGISLTFVGVGVVGQLVKQVHCKVLHLATSGQEFTLRIGYLRALHPDWLPPRPQILGATTLSAKGLQVTLIILTLSIAKL